MSRPYRTASTAAEGITDGVTSTRVRFAIMELPSGDVHAYPAAAAYTLCGLPLDGLRIWPDLPFPVLAYPRKCERCEVLSSDDAPYSPAA